MPERKAEGPAEVAWPVNAEAASRTVAASDPSPGAEIDP